MLRGQAGSSTEPAKEGWGTVADSLHSQDPTWIIDPLDGVCSRSSWIGSGVLIFIDCQLCAPLPRLLRLRGLLHQVSSPSASASSGISQSPGRPQLTFRNSRSKKPVAGAIFAPLLGGLHPTNASGTLYSAALSHGAWSTPISFPFDPSVLLPPLPSLTYASMKPMPFHHSVQLPYLPPPPIPAEAPKGCLFTAEWGKARADAPGSNLTKKVATFWNMAAEVGGREGKGGMVHGVRSLGSAALDMAYVATGAVDMYVARRFLPGFLADRLASLISDSGKQVAGNGTCALASSSSPKREVASSLRSHQRTYRRTRPFRTPTWDRASISRYVHALRRRTRR